MDNDQNYFDVARVKDPTQLWYTDSPSITQLEVLRVEMNRNPSFGMIRRAIQSMDYYVQNNVMIEMSYRDYDCTGQSFTGGIERIKRQLVKAYGKDHSEVWMLIDMYEHTICMDV